MPGAYFLRFFRFFRTRRGVGVVISVEDAQLMTETLLRDKGHGPKAIQLWHSASRAYIVIAHSGPMTQGRLALALDRSRRDGTIARAVQCLCDMGLLTKRHPTTGDLEAYRRRLEDAGLAPRVIARRVVGMQVHGLIDLADRRPAPAVVSVLTQAVRCKCGAEPTLDIDGDPVCWRCGRQAVAA